MDLASTPESIDYATPQAPSTALAWATILKIAKRAMVDPKTVKRRLNGKPTRRGTGRRIDAALKLYKLDKYIPGPPATPPASALAAERAEDVPGESQPAT